MVLFKDSQSTPYVASNKSHVCRPLSQSETLEIVWTAYPPEACDLQDKARSRWIRPVVGGKEAYALLGEQNKERPIMWTFLNRRRWKWCSFATPGTFTGKIYGALWRHSLEQWMNVLFILGIQYILKLRIF